VLIYSYLYDYICKQQTFRRGNNAYNIAKAERAIASRVNRLFASFTHSAYMFRMGEAFWPINCLRALRRKVDI